MKGIIFVGILLGILLGGCRGDLGDKVVSKEAVSDEHLVVIRQVEGAHGEGGSCQSRLNCHLPLVCEEGICKIPPSVVNRVGVSTKSINVVNPDGRVESLYIEEAESEYERALGLMFRKKIDDGWGMFFRVGAERELSFWMRNTFMALDIIFIDKDGIVLNIHEQCTPLDDRKSYNSEGMASYVLELGGGRAKALGIRVGSKVIH